VSAGIPRLRSAAARHFITVALRHWRPGVGRADVDRPPPRSGPILVAGLAAGTYRVRELSLSIPIILRRQLVADQPGWPDLGWTVKSKRRRGPVLPGNRGRLRCRHIVQAPFARNGLDQ